MAKRWQFRGETQSSFSPEIIQAANGSPLLAQLLYNRQIKTPQAIDAFLNLDTYTPTSGFTLPDMSVAVARVLEAIEKQQGILVYGDFDVDGITGTSVLMETLTQLGATVSFYIPDRATEGHGLNTAALCRLVSARKTKLVITTDTGIGNFAEVSLLKGLGVDTVITDHHALPENLPPALAAVNPQRLLKEDPDHPLGVLCGVGVAYKLCELLLQETGHPAEEADALLDLVATGTVADLVPLQRENRYLVYRGLQVLRGRNRVGLAEILSQAGIAPDAPVSSETIGFGIGPRLNALGRLDKAEEAVTLLTTDDPAVAQPIAQKLELLNRKRKDLCDQTFLEAEKALSAKGGLAGERVIILASPDWHPGVIGIVASRLIEKYNVPVFLLVVEAEKGEARCSARSIPDFDLYAALCHLSSFFTHFGGHAGAGGFALKLEHLDAFKQALYTYTRKTIRDDHLVPIVSVDTVLTGSHVSTDLVTSLSALAPFGQENPSPQFLLEATTVANQRGLGADGRHKKLTLTLPGAQEPVEALIWNASLEDSFLPGTRYDFVAVPELNTFRNVTKVQLVVADSRIHPADSQKAIQKGVHPSIAKPSERSSNDDAADTANDGVGFVLVDHRHHHALESVMSQLLAELKAASHNQSNSQSVRVYNEGRAPAIPFLEEALLCDRNTLSATDTLVFWDIPPDLAAMQQVLAITRPKLIHFAAGKYQTLPVFPAPQDYLRGMLAIIRQLLVANPEQGDLSLDTLTSRLSANRSVVFSGLSALCEMGYVRIQSFEPETYTASIRLETPAAPMPVSALTHIGFGESLRQMGQFRDWLLSRSTDQVKSFLALAVSDASSSARSYPTMVSAPGSKVTLNR